MKDMLSRLLRDHGIPAVASVALLASLALFHASALGPLKARDAELAERVSRQAPGAPVAQPISSADKLAAVYRHLRQDEDATDWLVRLHAIGAATGIELKSATYRTQHTDGRILRYEIVLPLAGSYPQIRDFLARLLADIPVLSLDQLTLKREKREDAAVQGELRLTLHMVRS